MAAVEDNGRVRIENKVKHCIIQDVYSICVYIMNCVFLTEMYRCAVMNLLLLHPLHFLIPLMQVAAQF
jgi:hypothetical protein